MPSCIIAWLFQSTLPLRGATHTERNGSLLTLFQSTLPLRGATVALRRDGVIQEHFNPHSPCGERLQQILDKANALLISIHTPLAGSDFSWAEWTPNTTLFQSTLPLRGATRTPTRSRRRGRYFNPHSPCGERLKSLPFAVSVILFQSTLPLRGATRTVRIMRWRFYFNPHSPCGERLITYGTVSDYLTFQSTLPLRGATTLFLVIKSLKSLFQSTLPLRGATYFPFTCFNVLSNFNPHSPCGERPQK